MYPGVKSDDQGLNCITTPLKKMSSTGNGEKFRIGLRPSRFLWHMGN